MRSPFSYQTAATQSVRDHWAAGRRSVVLVAPVGAGKTFCGQLLVRKVVATAWGQVWWIAHNDTLIDQPAIGFDDDEIPYAFVKAGRDADPDAQVQVCSAQTLVRRDIVVAKGPDGRPFRRALVVIDEAHRVKASTYLEIRERLLRSYEFVYFLLLTATPYRLDGRGLADVADALVEAATPRQLMDSGRILEPLYWSQPPPEGDADEVARRPAVMGDALKSWQKYARGLPTLVRCRSLAHSRAMAEEFQRAGIRAAHVDGSMSLAERRRFVCGLAIGGVASSHPLALDVLFTGSNLFDEGFDSRASWEMLLRGLPELADFWLPGATAPPEYRPLSVLLDLNRTNSPGAWAQLQGRVVRAWPGKDVAIVLCLSGNLEAHGFLCQHHGFRLDQDAGWARKARAGDGVPRLSAAAPRRCGACLSVEPPGSERCRACGADLGPAPRLPEEDRTVELVQVFSRSDAPPADVSVQEAFLRKKWSEKLQQDAIRAQVGRSPYSDKWPGQQFLVRFKRWPPRAMEDMIKRELDLPKS